MSDRNTRFIDRVRCERTALSCVNGAFKGAPPLAALSVAAISVWRDAAATSFSKTKVDAVFVLLRELSSRLDIQSNNSREVFEIAISAPDISILLESLRNKCGVA